MQRGQGRFVWMKCSLPKAWRSRWLMNAEKPLGDLEKCRHCPLPLLLVMVSLLDTPSVLTTGTSHAYPPPFLFIFVIFLLPEPVLCEKTLKNQKAMNAVFEAMGFDVLCSTDRTGAVVQLRYLLPELDLEKIQKMTWALYVQMEQVYPVTAFPSSTTGILPCQGNVDKDLWMFVLNMTQREEINIGMARLYCDPVGWNFNTMALDDARDPTSYVAREVIRLKDKFLSLTGKRFDETVAEDLHQQSRIVRSSDLRRQVGNG